MKKWIRWIVHRALALLGLSTGLGLIAACIYWLANRTNGSIVSSGKKRRYLLYVPKRYDPARPAPLVISIHGYAEWPAHQMQISRWNGLADRYGFLVVYPSGTGFPLQWHTHGESGSATGPFADVAFISDLIDRLENQYNIDPARIYANGLSNGGGMSFLLACKLSERIAAVGMVSGAYLLPWNECQPTHKVPAILFHGTEDPIVPYQGGPSRSFDLPFPYIPDWVTALAQHNDCDAAHDPIPACGEVSGVRYPGGASGADVVFYTIVGGGHSWPGSHPIPAFIVGHTTQDIDATRTMWDFFEAHPMHGK